MNKIVSLSRVLEMHDQSVKSDISSIEVLNISDELCKFI